MQIKSSIIFLEGREKPFRSSFFLFFFNS